LHQPLDRLRRWGRAIKQDVLALWFCCRHPRTPLLAKLLALAIAAYALSPIDLIPDFIPVLGYLDELILLPAAIIVVLKLIPADVLVECRAQASRWTEENRGRPRSYAGAAVVVLLWLCLAWLGWKLVDRLLH
jgi:uncharacterized membrane protein YkvA (DUF1232 family)